MKEKATELNLERQMADLERSMPETTKYERRMIRAALDIFSGTLEFLPQDPKNTTNAEPPKLNTGLLFDLKSVERIL
jgi:hypothetical protein